MKLIHDSAPSLLHLLLLVELIAHTSSHPAHNSALCRTFTSMTHQLEALINVSKKIHKLSDEELLNFVAANNRLETLPEMHHTAEHLSSMKVNESLSELHVFTQSFKFHVNWLKTEQDNFSLPSEAAEGAGKHLQHLNNLIKSAFQQLGEDQTSSPAPSLPAVSTTFDVLQYSVEISDRLKTFSVWSKRVVLQLRRLSRCPKH